MSKKQPSADEANQSKDPEVLLSKPKGKKNNSSKQNESDSSGREVLIKVGGFEYKTPTKQTRVFLGALVIGLNLLLVLATILYLYNPSFKEFIYNVGRS